MSSSRRDFLLGVAGGACVAMAGFGAFGAKAATGLPRPPLMGDEKAPKRLEVWGSYTCPFTAALLPILARIVLSKPKTVSLEWHHFPTHPPDPALHVAGLAFKDAHFWGFSSRILNMVLKAGGVYKGLTPEKLAEFARAEGGNEDMLTAAYADQANWDAVKADLIAGQLLGVRATPGLFYGGYFLTPKGVPRNVKAFEKSLRTMIEQG
jgi:protein-disulfide isomerase